MAELNTNQVVNAYIIISDEAVPRLKGLKIVPTHGSPGQYWFRLCVGTYRSTNDPFIAFDQSFEDDLHRLALPALSRTYLSRKEKKAIAKFLNCQVWSIEQGRSGPHLHGFAKSNPTHVFELNTNGKFVVSELPMDT